MVKSKWTVSFLGIETNVVDRSVKQVYLIVKLEDNLFKDGKNTIYKTGDQVALHLRNIIFNDLGITDLNVFDKKFCENLSKHFDSKFEILEEDENNFNLVDVSCLKKAIVQSK